MRQTPIVYPNRNKKLSHARAAEVINLMKGAFGLGVVSDGKGRSRFSPKNEHSMAVVKARGYLERAQKQPQRSKHTRAAALLVSAIATGKFEPIKGAQGRGKK
jgi:hypothetical protein